MKNGERADYRLDHEPTGSSWKVCIGIMQDIEDRRMVPGQRLAETDLAARFGVGRNAVREAMQHLAARGIVDLRPNKSPAIRQVDLEEALEVLDVAAAMMRLAARTAVTGYRPSHAGLLEGVAAELTKAASSGEAGAFDHARRSFYRALLMIGGNRELQRLFPAIGMHMVHIQYPSLRLQNIRLSDYLAICRAITENDADAAEIAAQTHVDHVREMIVELVDSEGKRRR